MAGEREGGRKGKGKGRDAGARRLGDKSVRLELADADHARFRVEAAREGLSMSAMARRIVEDWLRRRQDREDAP